MLKPFLQVDVFGDGPFTGNPVAVIAEGQDLSDEQMRAISRWTNLSECAFLLPPTTAEADYRVRIFALDTELSFAGHPTLGAARAWLDLGNEPRSAGVVVQECGVGLVPVHIGEDTLSFGAPGLVRSGPVSRAARKMLTDALGVTEDQVVDAAWVDNGPGWVAVLLDSAATVLAVTPDVTKIPEPEYRFLGVVGVQPEGSATALELRAFFPDDTGALREDPVTGSLNASVAQWLEYSGRMSPPYVSSQGTVLQRRGRVHIEGEGEALWVGGRTHVAISGSIDIPVENVEAPEQ
ncbi:PhzF family phenazine biosynthesis protein [Nesterenkonia halotolerans]|uniref:PhzF family phenazine biosynthesis protein n=1 Tax=Nesterenkonia halotolerans TaxID=225325 RepID=A0ABR9J714_9MICC|nr:PhzF family phenazine biosynthesis protein [Nesterenkonia halotolerans]MBE1514634.1 PhzF family phenazine biosynthesis protein [Nesterenkonia halotolerans]